MGYKLAGFDVVGGVEIDPQMMNIYRKNFNPKHSYLEGVQSFRKRTDIPDELFGIDVLDGSPPCSSFSMAGSREKAWGKKKKFREGQADQVLDDLFFDFIEISKLLRPRIVVAENVKGLINGVARGYVKMIFDQLAAAGYDTQLFLLNSSRMGVPQARERTFFVARRQDLKISKLELRFDEKPIPVIDAIRGITGNTIEALTPGIAKHWPNVMIGKSFSDAADGSLFSWSKTDPMRPARTVTATHCQTHWNEPRLISKEEVVRIQSFPDDYDFMDAYGPYVCGMSVPPFMMQRVATKVAKTLL